MAEKYLGESIKNLGFGLMRLPMLGDEIDIEQTKRMVDTFMAKGFTYFDTAYVYIGGKSEVAPARWKPFSRPLWIGPGWSITISTCFTA